MQIKKHPGTTDRQAVEQLLRMLEESPSADACVMSPADGFAEDAERLAEGNGIVLPDGEMICSLLFLTWGSRRI